MTKFAQLAPASSIKAADLDQNFREVGPSENQDLRQVRLFRGQDGWKMEVFPEFPVEMALLSTSGDQPFWLSVGELLNELVAAGLVAEVVDQLNNGGTVSAGSAGGGAQVPDVDELVVQTYEPSLNPEEPAAENWKSLVDLLNTLTDEQKLTIINNWLAQIAADDGGIGVREIERCDGQRMKVLGTVWYSP